MGQQVAVEIPVKEKNRAEKKQALGEGEGEYVHCRSRTVRSGTRGSKQ